MTNEFLAKIMKMGPNDKDAFLEKLVSEIAGIEAVLAAKNAVVINMKNEVKGAAQEILDSFEEAMRRFETENFELVKQNKEYKQKLGELEGSKEKIADLNARIEQIMRDYDKALKERDEAKESLAKIQKQWESFISGS